MTAATYLKHYFKIVFDKAGLSWTSDNTGEMDELVDAITAPQERRIAVLEQQVAALSEVVYRLEGK